MGDIRTQIRALFLTDNYTKIPPIRNTDMTISRRKLISSGLTVLAAASAPLQAFADARKAGGNPIEYMKVDMSIKGDGAPKPIQIKVPDWKWDYLQLSEIIISSLRKGSGGEDRLTESLSLNLKTMENALRKANKGEGLVEGENIVRAQLKNPKWSITIKIVIKF